MKGDILKNNTFSVLGAARSGISAANFLYKAGKDVILSDIKDSIDERYKNRLLPGVRVELGKNVVREGDVVVISPGIKPSSPVFKMAEQKGKALISEVELFYHAFKNGKLIAITGTDGKSTTTKLIGDILKGNGYSVYTGGNLGNPITEALMTGEEYDFFVCEVSCFQLITTHDFKPDVAVITNIARDHIDYHGSFEEYQKAKQLIYKNMSAGDHLVINHDDSRIKSWNIKGEFSISEFSLAGSSKADSYFVDNTIFLHGKPFYDFSSFPAPGLHNAANVMAALLATERFWVDRHKVFDVLNSFLPLPHRMEFAGEVSGVKFLNDSKATNPHAAIAGLLGLSGKPLIVIAGGYDKGSDFTELGKVLFKTAKHVVLTGATKNRIKEALPPGMSFEIADDFEDAVVRGFKAAKKGDYVVLSPACSSFDSFKDYEHRGDVFKKIVSNLKTRRS